jgi:hypothetical protein
MSDQNNRFQNGRQKPFPLVEDGKSYQQNLQARSQAILNALINLLPSNYESTVIGPEYTVYMKAMATELSRLTFILDQMADSVSFADVRSEFLWETIGYLVFLNQNVPNLEFDDESFRKFLLKIIDIYFKGSTPAAIAEGIALFTDDDFVIRENFQENIFDISDQFGFFVDLELEAQFPPNLFELDANIRLLLEIIRPAHTLYRLRNIFTDGIDITDQVKDAFQWDLYNYYYDDIRKYCDGMAGFSSDTGYILFGTQNTLRDDAPTKPLESVAINATLLIPEGPNSGYYTVLSKANGLVTVFPSFKSPENPVSYTIEVDRRGTKKEIFIEEDVTAQFYDLERFTVSISGPPTISAFANITLEAFSNGVDVSYAWDINGNNVYSVTGNPINFPAPAAPATLYVWVRATDVRGRIARARFEIEVV